MSGIEPDAIVVVATIRALKMHGGGPTVKPGLPLADEYTSENLELVEKGCENLIAHIETVKKSGVTPVVCVNGFYTDTKDEIALVRRIAEENGAIAAVSQHWLKGGEGAVELAEAVEFRSTGSRAAKARSSWPRRLLTHVSSRTTSSSSTSWRRHLDSESS
jgi:formate--tetrahydrofolate ligase